ncbi:unnamed protein product, partial [marine sediment metagenome]
VRFRRRAPLSLPDAEQLLQKAREQLRKLREEGVSHGDLRRAETKVRGAIAEVARAKKPPGSPQIVSEVQALKIGDIGLVGVPGEPFTETVLAIKQCSPFAATAAVSYANDEIGYFPDARSVSAGTYEVLKSPFGSDAAEVLREAALRTLRNART